MISASSINYSVSQPQTPQPSASDPSAKQSAAENQTESQVSQKKTNESTTVTPAQTEQDKQLVTELKARDKEVRTHEAAHKAAGGSLTGAASYSYKTGPDGQKYATGGEVSIDTGKVANDPEATIRKAQIIRAAALAPASPSAQDQAVASQASAMATEAQGEIVALQLQTSEAQKPTLAAKGDSNENSEAGDTTETNPAIARYQATAANSPGNGSLLDQMV